MGRHLQGSGSEGSQSSARTLGSLFHIACCAVLLSIAFSSTQGQSQTTPSVSSIESLIRSHDYDQALAMTRSALDQAPNDSRLWTLEGIVLSMKGDNPEALNSFAKAVSLSPNNMAALKGEGQLFFQAHDKRGIPVLEKIVKIDANDKTAHEMLANLEKEQQDCPSAVANFLQSGEVIRTHPESLEAYGYCLVQLKQPEKAIPVFEQLASMLPESTYPKYDLAVLLVQTKQNQSAIQFLEPLLTKDPPDPDVLSLASEAYEAVGDTPKAATLLRQAIVLSPTDATLYNSFAALSINHESFKVGIDMVNAGLERIPNDPSLYISRGLLYAELADYDKAVADFSTAERLDSSQSLSSYALALAEIQKGQRDASNPDQTLSDVRSQLRAHPDSALLHYLLAKLLVNQAPAPDSESFHEAMRSAQLAVKIKPNLVEARDLLASMYLRSEKYDLAAEQCRLALQYAPSDQSATYHLIIALRHSGTAKDNQEIGSLVKHLSQLEQSTLQEDTDRKRFRLVEQPAPPRK
jgi:tetratricopeptide (TPR) repeat protein